MSVSSSAIRTHAALTVPLYHANSTYQPLKPADIEILANQFNHDNDVFLAGISQHGLFELTAVEPTQDISALTAGLKDALVQQRTLAAQQGHLTGYFANLPNTQTADEMAKYATVTVGFNTANAETAGMLLKVLTVATPSLLEMFSNESNIDNGQPNRSNHLRRAAIDATGKATFAAAILQSPDPVVTYQDLIAQQSAGITPDITLQHDKQNGYTVAVSLGYAPHADLQVQFMHALVGTPDNLKQTAQVLKRSHLSVETPADAIATSGHVAELRQDVASQQSKATFDGDRSLSDPSHGLAYRGMIAGNMNYNQSSILHSVQRSPRLRDLADLYAFEAATMSDPKVPVVKPRYAFEFV